jgi:hypothetical protein
MEQRGRKSAESLSVVSISAPERPEPPDRLSPEEAELWRSIVSGMRADWFGAAAQPLLGIYVFELATAERIAAELRGLKVTDPQFKRLRTMFSQASRQAALLASRLRLTPRANRESIRDGRVAYSGRPPWEE